jgi:hypothetical protein
MWTIDMDVNETREPTPQEIAEAKRQMDIVKIVEKIQQSEKLALPENAYLNNYELNPVSTLGYAKKSLRKQIVQTAYSGDRFYIGTDGLDKVTHHRNPDDIHLKSIIHIPAIIRDSILLSEQNPSKPDKKFTSYKYGITSIKMDKKEYLIKTTFGTKDGKRWEYYDHVLSEVKKKPDSKARVKSPSMLLASLDIKDTITRELLQALFDNSSKATDENPAYGVDEQGGI